MVINDSIMLALIPAVVTIVTSIFHYLGIKATNKKTDQVAEKTEEVKQIAESHLAAQDEHLNYQTSKIENIEKLANGRSENDRLEIKRLRAEIDRLFREKTQLEELLRVKFNIEPNDKIA